LWLVQAHFSAETNGRISNEYERLASSAMVPYSNESATNATKGVGTKSYASPEQLESADYGAKVNNFNLTWFKLF
jgi:hypothetical protein